MKRASLFLMAGLLFAQLPGTAYAQLYARQPEAISRKLVKANQRALDDFHRRFPLPASVRWNNDGRQITASMVVDNQQIVMFYDRRGRWLRKSAVPYGF